MGIENEVRTRLVVLAVQPCVSYKTTSVAQQSGKSHPGASFPAEHTSSTINSPSLFLLVILVIAIAPFAAKTEGQNHAEPPLVWRCTCGRLHLPHARCVLRAFPPRDICRAQHKSGEGAFWTPAKQRAGTHGTISSNNKNESRHGRRLAGPCGFGRNAANDFRSRRQKCAGPGTVPTPASFVFFCALVGKI